MQIYINKIGVACSAGCNENELWETVTTGNQNGIKKVTTKIAPKEFFVAKIDDEKLCETSAKYNMRIFRIEETALNQIENEVNSLKEKFGKNRIAVVTGTCDNGTEFSVAGHSEFFKTGKFPENYDIELQGADYAATFISKKFDITGPCVAIETACSSGAASIIRGCQLIKSGMADAVVAGGVDIASETVLLGFDSLEAVSETITNPFSKNRSGITLGEAAAFFVISKEKMYDDNVKILGYGESADAYHATSPDPSGDGAARAMKAALENAGISPEKIDYINLHGTGTKFNDSMEAKACENIFANALSKIKMSTTKPLTGHTLGASGTLEATICAITLKNNIGKTGKEVKLPVQVWDGESDKELPKLNFVSKESNSDDCAKAPEIVMSNSFAFGGSNASLILGSDNHETKIIK